MAQYDPNKRYTWGPDSKFELSGQDFGLILNTIRTFLGTEEAGRYQLMTRANDIIERLMEEGVKNDVVVEAEAPAEVPPISMTPVK
ncbi:MAG: hypothetical protein CMJ25_22835 [Phycisphaerae bacterium]|jgi:hypothetical protein|nr:hypothetical protein [Phycisphaerae bacterium]|tara:strand:- start:459 stop:716 length:258 start_codon:yes stop_codon:yes gene_type:complete